MNHLPERFVEDRALRDKARAVLAADIERLRGALDEEGIASRVSSGVTASITDRIKAGARDVIEGVRARADDSKGLLALLVGALVLWFARGPIMQWFDDLAAAIEAALDEEDEAADTPATAEGGEPQ